MSLGPVWPTSHSSSSPHKTLLVMGAWRHSASSAPSQPNTVHTDLSFMIWFQLVVSSGFTWVLCQLHIHYSPNWCAGLCAEHSPYRLTTQSLSTATTVAHKAAQFRVSSGVTLDGVVPEAMEKTLPLWWMEQNIGSASGYKIRAMHKLTLKWQPNVVEWFLKQSSIKSTLWANWAFWRWF